MYWQRFQPYGTKSDSCNVRYEYEKEWMQVHTIDTKSHPFLYFLKYDAIRYRCLMILHTKKGFTLLGIQESTPAGWWSISPKDISIMIDNKQLLLCIMTTMNDHLMIHPSHFDLILDAWCRLDYRLDPEMRLHTKILGITCTRSCPLLWDKLQARYNDTYNEIILIQEHGRV